MFRRVGGGGAGGSCDMGGRHVRGPFFFEAGWCSARTQVSPHAIVIHLLSDKVAYPSESSAWRPYRAIVEKSPPDVYQ